MRFEDIMIDKTTLSKQTVRTMEVYKIMFSYLVTKMLKKIEVS